MIQIADVVRHTVARVLRTISIVVEHCTWIVHQMSSHYIEKISRALMVLRGRWAVQIIMAMRDGPVRLSELKRQIPLASKKAITAQLRGFEAAGLIIRRDLSAVVLHVEYELDESLRMSLVAVLDHLADWGSLLDQERSAAD